MIRFLKITVKANPLPSLGIVWKKARFSFREALAAHGGLAAKFWWITAAIQVKSSTRGARRPDPHLINPMAQANVP
jgi:hypothetical protein